MSQEPKVFEYRFVSSTARIPREKIGGECSIVDHMKMAPVSAITDQHAFDSPR